MIKKLDTSKGNIVALEAQGLLTKEDYMEIIDPVIENAKRNKEKLKFLYYFGPQFEGFTSGAAWEDFKLGIHNFENFEKIAVVSDKSWLRNITLVFSPLIPCAVRVFKNAQLNEAENWLSSELSLNYYFDKETGVLTLEVDAPFTADDFSNISQTVDSWLRKNKDLHGIIVHAKEFPGWENLNGFLSHIKFVKEHHKKIKKIAVVADGFLPNFMPALAKHFVKADIKHFPYAHLSEANQWIIQR